MLKPALIAVALTLSAVSAFSVEAIGRDRDAYDIPQVMQFTLTPLSGDRAQFSLRFNSGRGGHSQSSDSLNSSKFQAIPRTAVSSQTASTISFRIVREAGAFNCSGIAGANTGSG